MMVVPPPPMGYNGGEGRLLINAAEEMKTVGGCPTGIVPPGLSS